MTGGAEPTPGGPVSEENSGRKILECAVDVVAAFVSHNTVRPAELPELIVAVHGALVRLAAPEPAEAPAGELKPAVPVKKSVTPDHIVCLEDGRRFKTLRRHLANLGMTQEQYRTRWSLPAEYPMVAPNYAARRSELAKAAGLGSARGTMQAA